MASSDSTVSRPIPVPDARSEGFWAAARSGVLALARCAACGAFALPPDVTCPTCTSPDPGFTFVPVDGRGTVRSWTVLHDSFLPGFRDDVPFVLVDVELDAQPGLRLIGRLLDGTASLAPEAAPRLALGARVEVDFERPAPDVALPAFRLEPVTP